MLTDVEIAQSAKMKPISEIAKKVGLEDDIKPRLHLRRLIGWKTILMEN